MNTDYLTGSPAESSQCVITTTVCVHNLIWGRFSEAILVYIL